MIVLFRSLVIASALALMAAIFIPFSKPYQAAFAVGSVPVALAVFCLSILLLVPLVPVSAYGLLRFRKWALVAAAGTMIPLCTLSVVVMLPTGFGTSVAPLGKIAVLVSSTLWLLAVMLFSSSGIRQRMADAR